MIHKEIPTWLYSWNASDSELVLRKIVCVVLIDLSLLDWKVPQTILNYILWYGREMNWVLSQEKKKEIQHENMPVEYHFILMAQYDGGELGTLLTGQNECWQAVRSISLQTPLSKTSIRWVLNVPLELETKALSCLANWRFI